MTVAIVSGVGYFYLTNLYDTRYTKGYEEGFTAGEISGKDAYINARSQMAVANLSRTAVLRLASLYMSDNYTEGQWNPCWIDFYFETTFVASVASTCNEINDQNHAGFLPSCRLGFLVMPFRFHLKAV